jgi:hypothetical protein
MKKYAVFVVILLFGIPVTWNMYQNSQIPASERIGNNEAKVDLVTHCKYEGAYSEDKNYFIFEIANDNQNDTSGYRRHEPTR